jgi:hypothetical protein
VNSARLQERFHLVPGDAQTDDATDGVDYLDAFGDNQKPAAAQATGFD